IGNLRCAALAGRNGSIDWFCPPRFDAPACFSKLLGTEQHGFWQIAPEQAPSKIQRHYEPDTLVLRTEFACDGGRVRLTDYMPVGDSAIIIRSVEGMAGTVPMRMRLAPRFNYGARTPRCRADAEGCRMMDEDGQQLLLRTSAGLELVDDRADALFEVSAGETVHFILQHLQAGEPAAA